ncbi:hypothetical protein GBAR_LOCUS4571, partial [Geodia barretti]
KIRKYSNILETKVLNRDKLRHRRRGEGRDR